MLQRLRAAVSRAPVRPLQPVPLTVAPLPPEPAAKKPKICGGTYTPVEPRALGRTYCQEGFVALTGAFSQEDIASMRKAAAAAFSHNATPPFPAGSLSETILFEPAFRPIFENEKLIGALRTLFGNDFVFVNEIGIQDSCFGGWHTDTSSAEGKGGHTFLWSPRFMTANVAIYLQDNGPCGGGLDIIPGSYTRNDPLAKSIRRDKGMNVEEFGPDEVDPYRDGLTITTKAGDALIFHMRTRHRASPAVQLPSTAEERKLAMFLIAGPNNDETRQYRAWLDEYDVISNTKRPIVPEQCRAFLSSRGLSMI